MKLTFSQKTIPPIQGWGGWFLEVTVIPRLAGTRTRKIPTYKGSKTEIGCDSEEG